MMNERVKMITRQTDTGSRRKHGRWRHTDRQRDGTITNRQIDADRTERRDGDIKKRQRDRDTTDRQRHDTQIEP